MPTILITGANRGLGLEYTRQYLARQWQVIACTRNTDADVLRSLPSERLRICKLDVADHDAVDRLAEELQDTVIDVLVNNAGTSGPKDAMESAAYSGTSNMDYRIWRQIFEVNVYGAFKIASAFHQNLVKSELGVLVNMSSDLGSVAQNTQGGMYSYRSSKASLNVVTKGLANDWPDIITIAMAPGWCQTELGGPGAQIDPADSVREQIETIDRLTDAQSGCFLDRFGGPVPW